MSTDVHLAAAVHMAALGSLTSLVAPALVLATRSRPGMRSVHVPAGIALPLFVVVHGAVMLTMPALAGTPIASLALHVALLVGAVIFWLPVLGARRLGDGMRCVYLFVGAPALDLAGVIMVARGDEVGGLSMIVGMLPLGLASLWLSWTWIRNDERAITASERLIPAGGGSSDRGATSLP